MPGKITPVSHLIFGDPAQPKRQWGYSWLGYRGRTPAHAAIRWAFMPWVYAFASVAVLVAAVGPWLAPGALRFILLATVYPAAAVIAVMVARRRPRS